MVTYARLLCLLVVPGDYVCFFMSVFRGVVIQPPCARPDRCYLAHYYVTDYHFHAISQTSMHILVASTGRLQARSHSQVSIYHHVFCLLPVYTGHLYSPDRFATWTRTPVD